jgi:hypothetical protein
MFNVKQVDSATQGREASREEIDDLMRHFPLAIAAYVTPSPFVIYFMIVNDDLMRHIPLVIAAYVTPPPFGYNKVHDCKH